MFRPNDLITRRMILPLAVQSFDIPELEVSARNLLIFLLPIPSVFIPIGGSSGLHRIAALFNSGDLSADAIVVLASYMATNRYQHHTEGLCSSIIVGNIQRYKTESSKKAAIFISVLAGSELVPADQASSELADIPEYHRMIFALLNHSGSSSYQLEVAYSILKTNLRSRDSNMASEAYLICTGLLESKSSDLIKADTLLNQQLPVEASMPRDDKINASLH